MVYSESACSKHADSGGLSIRGNNREIIAFERLDRQGTLTAKRLKGRGVGNTELLQGAQSSFDRLHLWSSSAMLQVRHAFTKKNEAYWLLVQGKQSAQEMRRRSQMPLYLGHARSSIGGYASDLVQ